MNKKRGLRYYGIILGVAFLSMVVLGLAGSIGDGEWSTSTVGVIFLVPVLFTTMMFVIDKGIEYITPKKYKEKQQEEDRFVNFLDVINEALESKTDFSIEDFRKLRTSDRLQKALQQAYRIYEHGESEDVSYEYLSKKFKKGTNEYIAINIVIDEVKKLKENS